MKGSEVIVWNNTYAFTHGSKYVRSTRAHTTSIHIQCNVFVCQLGSQPVFRQSSVPSGGAADVELCVACCMTYRQSIQLRK